MWWPATRIRHKIALPFTLLFVLAIGATAIISVVVMSTNLERRAHQQILRTSEIIARSDLVENPIILAMVKQMVDAEIVTFDRRGAVVAATADDPSLTRLVGAELEKVGPLDHERSLAVSLLEHEGVVYRATYRHANGRSGVVTAFVVNTAATVAARRQVAVSISLLSLFILLVMALLSRRIARGITQPMEQLVEHTHRLAAGDLDRRAAIGTRDEVGRLAIAINEMAEQLRELEEKVLHSEKLALTGHLAARVAHDVRTPMTSIKAEAQLLRRVADASTRRSLDAILRQVDRVERVIRGLLDLARPAALHLVPGDVNEVVVSALATTEATLRHHRISVTKRLQDRLPSVRLDAASLEQALLNVVQNSIEALPAGGKIRVSTETIEGGEAVRIEISDQGTGIDPLDEERVFDPFFTTKRDGVGLGLVNTRSIVERHGGTVELRTVEGGGTRTWIRLPTAPATEDDARVADPVGIRATEATAATDG